MQFRHLPIINRRYWMAILFASVFGTNLGDLYAHDSGLGIGLGLLLLLGLFIATYALETRDRQARELYYWTAIIIIRTGATNIADYLAFRLRIPQLILALGLAAMIAVLGWRSTPVRSDGELAAMANRDRFRLGYWSAMLCAGVFGTVMGDVCSHRFGQGPSALALTAGLVAALAILQGRTAGTALAYWSVVALARTGGTCLGDWLAETRLLHLGLPLSTLLTGAAFVAILAFRGPARSAPWCAPAPGAATSTPSIW